jgi:hypothetical protein
VHRTGKTAYPKFPLLIRVHQCIAAALRKVGTFTMRPLFVCSYVLSALPLFADALVVLTIDGCDPVGMAGTTTVTSPFSAHYSIGCTNIYDGLLTASGSASLNGASADVYDRDSRGSLGALIAGLRKLADQCAVYRSSAGCRSTGAGYLHSARLTQWLD